MRRTTRSQSRQASVPAAFIVPPTHKPILLNTATIPPSVSISLPNYFTSKLTGLSRASNTLLNNKRSKLQASDARLRRKFRNINKPTQEQLLRSLDATLVFAQEEAGTAVCISPTGLLLTCSHCVADDMDTALDHSNSHWLIFARGTVVRAVCVAWNPHRDLALLQITASEPFATAPSLPSSSTSSTTNISFPYATISPLTSLLLTHPLFCIGHPGSEDLEASTPGQLTGYDVLHISKGMYHGMSPGQDPQDNSEIGALMHDCWTYWGHSGAPILDGEGGGLVGLHSSWDEETGMRRGVGTEAIRAFLCEKTTFGLRRIRWETQVRSEVCAFVVLLISL